MNMTITKTLNLFIAGSFFAIAGTATAQQGPSVQSERERPQAPQQQQRQQIQPPQQEETPDRDPAELQAELEELRGEVEEISERLNDIHQEALLEEDARKALVEYETTFNGAIGDSAPGLEEQVEAHADVLKEIEQVGEAGDEDKLKALLEEYNEVKQQLAPVESQLFNNEDLLEARTEYQEDLIAAMKVVDPKVEEIIDERMALAQEFMSLQQELVQSQQSQEAPQGQQGQQGGGAPQSGQQQDRQAPQQRQAPQPPQ